MSFDKIDFENDNSVPQLEKIPLASLPRLWDNSIPNDSLPVLENWHVEMGPLSTLVVRGQIYNDSRFPDGTHIHTSSLVAVGNNRLQTLNTLYKLGVVKS